jgi:hypothetical protein
MRARHALFVVCLGVGLSVLSATAHAQQPDYEAAREAYMTAEKAFAKGEFDVAAREFGIAYDITKDPVLFYRIALSYEKAGDCDTAVVYFGRYLKEGKPGDAERKLAEKSVARCTSSGDNTGTGDTGNTGTGDTGTGDTGAGDTGNTGTGDTGAGDTGDTGAGDTGDTGAGGITTPPPFEDDKPTWKRTAAWVSVGATVAFVTTGAVLGLSASSRQEDIDNLIDFRDQDMMPQAFEGTIQEKYDDLVDEGKQLDMLSKVAFGLAGAAAISATVFFVLDAGSSGSSDEGVVSRNTGGGHLTPVVGARGELGASMGWEF